LIDDSIQSARPPVDFSRRRQNRRR
jgi:hypothetical protein